MNSSDEINRREFEGTVAGFVVKISEPTNRGGVEGDAYILNHLIVRRVDNGAIIATIHRDSLFDQDGNRFSFG